MTRINAAAVVAKWRGIVIKVAQTIYNDYCKIIKCLWTRCVLCAIYLFVEITPGSTGGGAWWVIWDELCRMVWMAQSWCCIITPWYCMISWMLAQAQNEWIWCCKWWKASPADCKQHQAQVGGNRVTEWVVGSALWYIWPIDAVYGECWE